MSMPDLLTLLIVFCLFGGFLRGCDFVWVIWITIKQGRKS